MKSWAVYIVVALGFFAYSTMSKVDRDSSGEIVGEGSVDAFHVRVGDCFDDASSSSTEVSSIPGVPCTEPHDNEAFAIFDLEVADYPEGEAMAELALEACKAHFDVFVGNDYQSSTLDIFTLFPSTDSWKQNDREVICAVYNMDASKLVGSAQGRAL